MRAAIGVSTLLPKEAREALIEASKQHSSIVLDNVLDEIKRKYPSYFKPEEELQNED